MKLNFSIINMFSKFFIKQFKNNSLALHATFMLRKKIIFKLLDLIF